VLEVISINGRKIYGVDLKDENTRNWLKELGADIEVLVKKDIKNQLNAITDQYFYNHAANRGDYRNMGEIYVDAQNNDPDAQYLLKLYDAVWDVEEAAENEIDQLSDLNQLLQILQDVPGYLLPKLGEAKQNLDASLTTSTTTEQ